MGGMRLSYGLHCMGECDGVMQWLMQQVYIGGCLAPR